MTNDACQYNTCSNGGTCSQDSQNNVICICKSGYSGLRCEISANCAQHSCQNGATCIDDTMTGGSYYCSCRANYYGKNCEIEVTDTVCNSGDSNKELCAKWSRAGHCSFGFTYKEVPVPVYCPESCGLCKQLSSCSDSQPNCSIWANLGLCAKVQAKDPNLCKKSCGQCESLVKK